MTFGGQWRDTHQLGDPVSRNSGAGESYGRATLHRVVCRTAICVGVAFELASVPCSADPATASACGSSAQAAFCQAVRGDRAEGWRMQSRSAVMAQHGIVATSQPLAAQAGLRILMRGGNAVDAAVATAAVLNVVEPMMTGIGGDLFAIVYVARERKLYALNASGTAPTGATIERLHSLGHDRDPQNAGPGSGMPVYGILPVTVPGAVWGFRSPSVSPAIGACRTPYLRPVRR
jgi:hypothetical protein